MLSHSTISRSWHERATSYRRSAPTALFPGTQCLTDDIRLCEQTSPGLADRARCRTKNAAGPGRLPPAGESAMLVRP